MRRFFEAVARALRGRRELAVALATAIVAAVLIGGGQGNLAAAVAAGAAGFMAGRACRYRLAAQEMRRQTAELGDELSNTEVSFSLLSRLAQERGAELSALKENLEQIAVESRRALDDYQDALSRDECVDWSVTSEFEFLIRNIELLVDTGRSSLTEQTQLIDTLRREDVDESYSDTEEVNTTDAAEE